MWAIDQPFPPAVRSLFTDTPARILGALGGVAVATAVLVRLEAIPGAALGVVGVAGAHGALLATAFAWAGAGARAALGPIVLLTAAATASAIHPLGALAYVGIPLWLLLRARDGALATLGLTGPVPWAAVLGGLTVGALLGAHLLVSASRTLGVRLRLGEPALVLADLAYDLGANVPATECFFRGALFDRAQRRWSLGAALALSTAACVARYLLDPRLPKHVEFVVGAAFYVALLSAANCWLFRWSGHLLPGAAAALSFFVAYRVLGLP